MSSNQVHLVLDQERRDKPLLSPQQVEQIGDDPSLMEEFARVLGAVNLDNLFRFMQGVDNPMAKLEFQKMLNKMGRLEPAGPAETAGGPQVVINITRALDRADEAVTIEATPNPTSI